MDVTTIAEGLLGLGSGLAIGRRYVYKPVRAAVTRVSAAFDELTAVRQALDLDEDGKSSLVDKVKSIEKAVGPNGGGSLADGLQRVEEQTGRTNELMQITSGRVDRLMDWIERPIYETDSDGRLTRPNEAFCKMAGLAADQLLGMGWINLVAEVDRKRLMEEISWAKRDRRAYRCRVTLESATGKRFEVLMVAQPKAADGKPGLLAYFGAVEVLRELEAKAS